MGLMSSWMFSIAPIRKRSISWLALWRAMWSFET
jgi:hypothetical protein